MEFKEVLQGRRSVRRFRDVPVDRSLLGGLIEAATLAPSANDLQPWEFWVIEGRDQLADLSTRASQWIRDPATQSLDADKLMQHLSLPSRDLDLFHGGQVLVLVAARSHDRQAIEDCDLAAYALTLAARDEGVGSCWIGSAISWFNLPSVKRELGIPEGNCVAAPIVLGYPEGSEAHMKRLPAIVHWCSTPAYLSRP